MDGRRRFGFFGIALLAAAAYFGYTQFIAPRPDPQEGEGESADEGSEAGENEGPTEADAEAGSHDGEAGALDGAEPGSVHRERQTATIHTSDFEATIDNLGGGISSFRILGDERFTQDGEPLNVITTQADAYQSLRMQLAEIGIPDDAVWELTQLSETRVRLRWEGRGVRVDRVLSAGAVAGDPPRHGPYQIWSHVRVTNVANYARQTRLELSAWHYVNREEESGGLFVSRSPKISHGNCAHGEDIERKDRDDLVDEDTHGPVVHGYGDGNNVRFAAVDNVYFVQAIAAHEGFPAARCAIEGEDRGAGGDPHGSLLRARLIYPWTTIEPGQSESWLSMAYIGPKDPHTLNLAGHDLPSVVDLGWFAIIARQFARLLSFIHGLVGNWGLAIILLTLMLRLALFPLTNLSFRSMARMRRLKPEVDRINELWADDREKKGAAIMELYRKHKINPLSGCLPSLMQFPIWLALYTSLSTNIELYHMPFALWWTDLSSPDPYFVLPVLLGAFMHLQQRITPTSMDPAQAKMMMYFMPIMITVFMLFLPSGLCLYMLTNSALGIGQQKLNEYRLNRAAENDAATSPEDSDPDDDGATLTQTSTSSSTTEPRRRTRRKRSRRARRG